MERSNQLIATLHRVLKKNPLRYLFLILPMLVVFFSCAIKSTFEMVGFMKEMTAQLEEREQFLIESAERPLTERQEKLLTQLLQKEGSLDMVLSSQTYLTYLKEHVGVAYKNYTAYLAAVPTTEQKSTTTFALKEILPSEATIEQIQLCTDFYFKFLEQIANEPDITSDSKKMGKFIEIHLVEPLMETDSSEVLEMTKLIKISSVPGAMAVVDTDVFHNIWLENLEVYGSREGLLRCAILTPDEFALMRSFFEDTAALEKWIKHPLK